MFLTDDRIINCYLIVNRIRLCTYGKKKKNFIHKTRAQFISINTRVSIIICHYIIVYHRHGGDLNTKSTPNSFKSLPRWRHCPMSVFRYPPGLFRRLQIDAHVKICETGRTKTAEHAASCPVKCSDELLLKLFIYFHQCVCILYVIVQEFTLARPLHFYNTLHNTLTQNMKIKIYTYYGNTIQSKK